MRLWTTTVAVHGGPRVAVAEGLTGAHARGHSGERELAVSWEKGEELWGGGEGGSSPRALVGGSTARRGRRR
jgi:hypothetical protein